MSDDTRLNDGSELEIAHEEDFGIRRDPDTEELLPVKQRIPGSDKAIKVKPVHGGAREKYADVFDSGDAEPERVAEVFNEFIVEGIGADADAEWVETGSPYGVVPALIQALKNSSGEDYFLAVLEQRDEEMRQNLKMLEMFDDDRLQPVLEAAANGSADGPE